MRTLPLVLAVALVAFAAGLLVGLGSSASNGDLAIGDALASDSDRGIGSVERSRARGDEDARRRSRESRRGGSAETDPDGTHPRGDDEHHEPRLVASAVLARLESAFASGDLDAMRRALHEHEVDGRTILSPEELASAEAMLRAAPPELVHDLARFLARHGGVEGARRIASIVSDGSMPLDMRFRVLEALAEVPPERAAEVAPIVEGLLGDSLPRDLRRDAAHVLGRLHGEGAFGRLMELAVTRPDLDAGILFDAAGDFGKAGDTDRLLELLASPRAQDWSQRERESLVHALGRTAAQSGESSRLLDLLVDPPASVSREMLARALANASHQSGPQLLEDALALASGDRRAQEELAQALARTGDAGIEALLRAREDPSIGLDDRSFARALGESGSRRATPLLLDLLATSRSRDIVEPLARGLFESGGSEAVNQLLERLAGDPDLERRRSIADALADVAPSGVDASRLVALLRGTHDDRTGEAIARALERLHPQYVESNARELFASASSPSERLAFARLIGRSDSPEGVPLLAEQLRRETDRGAQREYARLLARRGPAGVEPLLDMLGSASDDRVRFEVLSGLEEGGRDVVGDHQDALFEVLARDRSPSVRRRAAEILGRHGDAAMLPRLEAMRAQETSAEVLEHLRGAIEALSALTRR